MKKYKIKLQIELAEEDEAKTLQIAREQCPGMATGNDGKRLGPDGPDNNIQAAIANLLDQRLFDSEDAVLASAGIRMTAIVVGAGEEATDEVGPSLAGF